MTPYLVSSYSPPREAQLSWPLSIKNNVQVAKEAAQQECKRRNVLCGIVALARRFYFLNRTQLHGRCIQVIKGN
jgi:hypothetical protein